MVVIRPGRGSEQQKELAKKELKTRKCPSCRREADAVEVKDDRIVYKCSNCGAVNTHTMSGAEYKEKPKDKKHKRSAFILRDRSEEMKEPSDKSDRMEGPPKSAKDGDEKEKTEETPKDVEEKPPAGQTIDNIRESMKDQRILTFEYKSAKGVKSSRAVEPYKIERNKKGEIVLWAWCQEGGGIRQFKLSGVSATEIQEYPFEPRFGVEDKL
jgi:predicted DNA-binding transcriptional regulator YafY